MTDALWKMPDDVLWALKQAAESGGFMPNTTTTMHFLALLEGRGFLRRSDVAPAWHITGEGRALLAGEVRLTKDDVMAIETLRSAVL